jgi:RNA polymerase sigma-70 factor (ECF subfamily)
MSVPGSEADLTARAIAGETGALEELLLLHYDRLAARVTGKIPASMRGVISAEDVLQESFLEVINRINSFEARESDSFYRWLATIAEHRLIDLVRAHRAAKRGGGRSPLEGSPAGESRSVVDLLSLLAVSERTPSRSVAGHEAVAAIRGALDQIKPDHRDALQMRYLEGLSVAATAERLGRTEAAIHMLCNRGLRALADVLGPDSKYLSRKA